MARLLSLSLLCVAPALSASPWPASVLARAATLASNLTLTEAISLMSGQNAGYGGPSAVSPYVGYTPGVPRLNIPALHYEDGPQGVGDGLLHVTQWPCLSTVAHSWRPELLEAWGYAQGEEQYGKGSSILLGPSVALVRVPWSGRAFEYPSEDPFLSSALTGPYVIGVQRANVSACVKHWALNSQEQFRGDAPGSAGMSSNIGERVGRELYGPQYAAAVNAGVGCVMCAFVRVNHTYACQSPEMLAQWLYTDLGFAGLTVSDWGGTHSTAPSATAGLTVEMDWQRNATYYGTALLAAVQTGEVPRSFVTTAATRVLATILATTDLTTTPWSPSTRNVSSVVTSPAHAALARTLAVAGTVLLQNTPLCPASPLFCTPLLPLDPTTLCRVAILGDQGLVGGGGSGSVQAEYLVTLAQGLAAALGPRTTLVVLDGTNVSAAAAAAADADVAVVLVGERTGEGKDRAGLALPPAQDALVAAVAAVQPKTTVVARCSGPCLMPWASSVPAILSTGYAGQEAGNALADVLLGLVSPAGKLTVSWPKSTEDTWLSASPGGPVDPSRYPGTDRGRGYPEVDYSEGLQVGYRYFDAQGLQPLFPFGHGLSYTAFNYSALAVSGSVTAGSNASVSFTVTNGGAVAGGEVAQLYVSAALPGDPPQALKGFRYTGVLGVGQSVQVALELSAAELAVWSEQQHSFVLFPQGSYSLMVGSSSRDVRLTGSVVVGA